MRKDRLLKLADFLETVPRRAFNMATWLANPASKPEGEAPGECGFAGCAVGWAAHQKMFRGLRFGEGKRKRSQIYYKGLSDWGAVREVFSISEGPAFHLFSSSSYDGWTATPKQVAKRIRKFVKDGGVQT